MEKRLCTRYNCRHYCDHGFVRSRQVSPASLNATRRSPASHRCLRSVWNLHACTKSSVSGFCSNQVTGQPFIGVVLLIHNQADLSKRARRPVHPAARHGRKRVSTFMIFPLFWIQPLVFHDNSPCPRSLLIHRRALFLNRSGLVHHYYLRFGLPSGLTTKLPLEMVMFMPLI